MDIDIEFTSQAYCKMVMHTIKYTHNICSGFLLSPKPVANSKQSKLTVRNRAQDEAEHDVQEDDYEDASEDGENDGGEIASNVEDDCSDEESENRDNHNRANAGDEQSVTKIVEAIPISHASHSLIPNLEIAFNAVDIFAREQDLVVSGYYQTLQSERQKDSNSHDSFSRRAAERISRQYPNAVLCYISFDQSNTANPILSPHQLVDGKWRRRSSGQFKVECDAELLNDKIIYTKERLYRKVFDFDDHFNDIALDWTNASLSQRIDHLVANVC